MWQWVNSMRGSGCNSTRGCWCNSTRVSVCNSTGDSVCNSTRGSAHYLWDAVDWSECHLLTVPVQFHKGVDLVWDRGGHNSYALSIDVVEQGALELRAPHDTHLVANLEREGEGEGEGWRGRGG